MQRFLSFAWWFPNTYLTYCKGRHFDGLRRERDSFANENRLLRERMVELERQAREIVAEIQAKTPEVQRLAQTLRGLLDATRRELADCRQQNIHLAQRAELAELRAIEAGRSR